MEVLYDKITMRRETNEDPFVCISNVIYACNDELDVGNIEFFVANGYVYVDVGSNEVEIYVNRLDVDALNRAMQYFFSEYILTK